MKIPYFWQERPEFSEVVAKLEECLCNVEVSCMHMTHISTVQYYSICLVHIHMCFYVCSAYVSSLQ